MHRKRTLARLKLHLFLLGKGREEMGRPLKKWPDYALSTLEATVDELKELERKAKAAQDALVAGNALEASSQMGDVRVAALRCVANLANAKIGKYEQQEKAQQWNRPEIKAAAAVAQVVASRRP